MNREKSDKLRKLNSKRGILEAGEKSDRSPESLIRPPLASQVQQQRPEGAKVSGRTRTLTLPGDQSQSSLSPWNFMCSPRLLEEPSGLLKSNKMRQKQKTPCRPLFAAHNAAGGSQALMLSSQGCSCRAGHWDWHVRGASPWIPVPVPSACLHAQTFKVTVSDCM